MVFNKNNEGRILPQLKITQRNEEIRKGNPEIEAKYDVYQKDYAALTQLNDAIHKKNGEMRKGSIVEKEYNKWAKNATAQQKEYGKELKDNTKTLSQWNDEHKVDTSGIQEPLTIGGQIKGLASNVISGAGNMLVNAAAGWVAGLAIQGVATIATTVWDKIAHKQENAILAGNEALQEYKETQESIAFGSQWIETNGARFEELAKGVSSLGSNLSLTTDEYKEYQSLVSQIASQFPELINGYDSLGRPIVNSIRNVSDLNTALKNQKIDKYTESVGNAKDVIEKFNAEALISATKIYQESGTEAQKIAVENFKKDLEQLYSLGIGINGTDLYNKYIGDPNTNADFLTALESIDMNSNDFQMLMYDIAGSTSFDQIDNESRAKLSSIFSLIATKEQEYQKQFLELKSILPAFFDSSEKYLTALEEAPQMSGQLTSILNSLDSDTMREKGFMGADIEGEEAVFNIETWADNLINALSKKDVQEAMDKVFSFNNLNTDDSYSKWLKNANEAVAELDKLTNNEIGWDKIREAAGITEIEKEIKDASILINNKWDGAYYKLREALSPQELIDLGEMSKDFVGTYEEAVEELNKINYNEQFSVSNMKRSVTDATSALSTYKTAISESMSSTGLTSNTIELLKNQFSELIKEGSALETLDLNNLFTKTASGVGLNVKAMELLNKELETQTKLDLAESIKIKGEELAKAINTGASFERVSSIEDELNTLKLLAAEYDGATSKFQKWLDARSTSNAGDNFRSLSTSMNEEAQKLYEEGRTNTDDFRAAAQYYSYKDLTGASQDEAEAAWAASEKFRNDYMDGTKEGIDNFIRDMHEISEANNFGWTEMKDGKLNYSGSDKELADYFGVSVDAIQDILKAASEYNEGIIVGDKDSIENVDEYINSLTQESNKLHEQLSSLTKDGEILESSKVTFDYEISELTRDEIGSKISELEEVKATLNLDTQEGQAALTLIESEIEALNNQDIALAIKAELANGTNIEELLNLENKELATKLGIDVVQAGTARDYLESLLGGESIEVPTIIKLDEEQFNTLISSLTGEVELETTTDTSTVENQIENIDPEPIEVDTEFNTPKQSLYAQLVERLGALNTGEAIGIETEVVGEGAQFIQALKNEGGTYTYTVLIDGETKELELLPTEDGNFVYTIKQEVEVDTQEIAPFTELAPFTSTTGETTAYAPPITATQTTDIILETGAVDVTALNDVEKEIPDFAPFTPIEQTTDIMLEIGNVDSSEVETVDSLEGIIKANQISDIVVDIEAEDNASHVIDYIIAKEVEDKIVTLIGEDEATPVLEIWNALAVDPKFTTLSAQDQASVVVDYWNSLTPETKEAFINGHITMTDTTAEGTDSANANIESVPKESNTVISATDNTASAVSSATFALDSINGKTAHTYIITHKSTSEEGVANGTATFATGTAYGNGTAISMWNNYRSSIGAYAQGNNWALTRNQDALINEIGNESIVRNGRWFEVPGGAHVEHLRKGDIIFNAAQTAELKKYGRVISGGGHGRLALANGTAYNMMNAYSSIEGWEFGNTGNKSTSSNTSATNNNTSAINNNTSATNDNTKAAEDFTETIDWVERRLEAFAKKTERIADSITDYISFAFKKQQLSRQFDALDDEIAVNQKAYVTYLNKANSVELSASWKKKVQQGDYNIEDIKDKSLAENIKKYQEYYDKAMDCRSAVQSLRNEQRQVFEDLMNLPTEKAEYKIDRLNKRLGSLENTYDSMSGGSATSAYLKQVQKDYGTKLNTATNQKKTATTKYNNAKSAATLSKTLVNSTSTAVNFTAKTLRTVVKNNKNSLTSAQINAINTAIKNGTKINTKGLSGAVLSYAKKYNASIDEKQKAVNAQKKANQTLANAKKNKVAAENEYNTVKNSLSDGQKTALKYGDDVTYRGQNALLDAELSIKKQENQARQTALKEANENLADQKQVRDTSKAARDRKQNAILGNKNITKYLSKAQLESIRAGRIVSTAGITNKTVLKQLKDYNELVTKYSLDAEDYTTALEAQEEALANASESQAEYTQMMVENEIKKFENIKNYYEALGGLNKALADSYSTDRKLKEAKGEDTVTEDYQKEIDEVQNQREIAQEELKTLEKQLETSVASGLIKEGSEEWIQMRETIIETENEVDNLDMEMMELQDTMRNDIFYRELNRALEKAEELRSSLSSIINLINDDMLFDDDGMYTDFGVTSLALNIKDYESYLESMETLLNKREQYIKNYNNGKNDTNYNQKEFEADMKTVEEEIRNMLSNTDGARKAIIDIILKQSKAELDATLEVIDAREELLKKQKEYYDYDKTLKSKTNDLQLLDQQIAALNGVTDAESKAQKARLEADRKKLQDELDETVLDHRYELQVAGLDDLKTELQENYDNYVKELNSNLETIISTVGTATGSINNCLNTVNETINKILGSYGIPGLTTDSIGVPTYASGSRFVKKSGTSLVNDAGQEIIVTKLGTFVPLSYGDGVVPADLTAKLFSMAQNYPSTTPQVTIPEIITSGTAESIAPVISCPITIMGNANEAEIANALKKNLPYITRTVQNEIRKDLRKSGR